VRHPEAVLISGAYGSGKSSVAAEMAGILEERGERYVYLDLDYLAWGYPGPDDDRLGHSMLVKNLAAVVANYLEAGVRLFVLAGLIASTEELESLRAAMGMPVRMARLTVPLEEIERRLSSDVTSARRDDLREAARQIASGEGVGLEDLEVSNDRDVRDVAEGVLRWLGWD
jgi:adenylylsulfate kinase